MNGSSMVDDDNLLLLYSKVKKFVFGSTNLDLMRGEGWLLKEEKKERIKKPSWIFKTKGWRFFFVVVRHWRSQFLCNNMFFFLCIKIELLNNRQSFQFYFVCRILHSLFPCRIEIHLIELIDQRFIELINRLIENQESTTQRRNKTSIQYTKTTTEYCNKITINWG